MDFPNKDADFTTKKEIEIFKKVKGKPTLYTGPGSTSAILVVYLLVNGIRHIESIQVKYHIMLHYKLPPIEFYFKECLLPPQQQQNNTPPSVQTSCFYSDLYRILIIINY